MSGRSRSPFRLAAAGALALLVGPLTPAAAGPAHPAGAEPPPSDASVDDEVPGIVLSAPTTRGAERARERVAAWRGAEVTRGGLGGDGHVLRLDERVSHADAQALADRLVREGLAASASPDITVHTATRPDDEHYGLQWYLSGEYQGGPATHIRIEEAWETTTGSADVTVAVLDTGALDHPDLVDRLVAGYDFVDGNADASDPGTCVHPDGELNTAPASWHGTHVAGTIGASTDNGIGIAGVDQAARIQPVRVLSDCGGDLSDLIAGIRWAAGLSVSGVPANPTPAQVLNLSLGGDLPSCPPELDAAVSAATDAGALVVAAAGNGADTGALNDAGGFAPANCADAMSVTATSRHGDRAYYANTGPSVDLAAPGGDSRYGFEARIYGLSNTGQDAPEMMAYRYEEGTSQATPQVAGVAALALAVAPATTPRQLRTLLTQQAQPFPTTSPFGQDALCIDEPTSPAHCGSGILDAGAVVEAVGDRPIVPTPPPTWDDDARLVFDLEDEAIRLSWPRAGGEVDAYEVLRDGSLLRTVTSRTTLVHGLPRDQRTTLSVRARNASGTSESLHRTVRPTAGFADVDPGSTFATDIRWLATAEVTLGCAPSRFCPTDPVTRQQMAAFLSRGLELTERSGVRFADVVRGSTFEDDIDRLATAGITRGCAPSRFCPTDPVTRQQMAAFLSRGLGLTERSGVRFTDVAPGSTFADDIDRLATAGITLGCGGDRFCPTDRVTRQQMAAFLRRGLT